MANELLTKKYNKAIVNLLYLIFLSVKLSETVKTLAISEF
ncbi:hypothetical protein SPWS13_3660 [Shewanella putrefaciens]|nr:hypothetical protein SPWS13_3660 [Shewanella putrefaciens]